MPLAVDSVSAAMPAWPLLRLPEFVEAVWLPRTDGNWVTNWRNGSAIGERAIGWPGHAVDPLDPEPAGGYEVVGSVEGTDAAGGTLLEEQEGLAARRDGVRALIRGNLWIDVTDPQFAEELGPRLRHAAFSPDGRWLAMARSWHRRRPAARAK